MAPSYAEVAKELRNEHPDDRGAASEKLSKLGLNGGPEEPIIIPAIGKNLDSVNWRVRKAAADALGELSTFEVWGREPTTTAKRSIPELVARLADEDCRVRRACAAPLHRLRAAGSLGDKSDIALLAAPAVPALMQRLHDDDWRVRENAVRAFGDLESSAALPAVETLAKLLADPGDRVRVAARAALEKLYASGALAHVSMYGAGAVPDLTDALDDEDWRVRCAATWALGQVGGCHAIAAPQLQKNLSSADWAARCLAVQSFGELGFSGMATIPDIALRLKDERDEVRKAARVALAKHSTALHNRKPAATPKVLSLLRRTESNIAQERKDALDILGELSIEALPAVPDIMRLLLDPETQVSGAADEALSKIGKAGVLGGLGIPPPNTASQFGKEMKPRSRPRMVEKLLRCLNDENWAVRLGAAEALATLAIRASFVIPAMEKCVEDEDSVDGREHHRFAQVAKRYLETVEEEGGLRYIDSALEDAIPELLDRADDKDETVAEMARGCIERLTLSGLLQQNNSDEGFMDNPDDVEEDLHMGAAQNAAVERAMELQREVSEEQGEEMIVDHEAEEELRRAAEEALGEPKSAPLGPAERAKNAAMRARGAIIEEEERGAVIEEAQDEDPLSPVMEFNCSNVRCQRGLKEFSNFCGRCGTRRPQDGWPAIPYRSSEDMPPTPPGGRSMSKRSSQL
jgi:HEAT repeat protein